MSLAGLYYYFDSKEKLLYLIQRHLFLSVMDLVRERLKEESDPEQRIRIFILAHLEYFLANPKSMKVLSHEDDVLNEKLGAEIARPQAPVLPLLRRPGGCPEDGQRAAVQLSRSCSLLVRHDELDIHLVQPARGWRCSDPGPRNRGRLPGGNARRPTVRVRRNHRPRLRTGERLPPPYELSLVDRKDSPAAERCPDRRRCRRRRFRSVRRERFNSRARVTASRTPVAPSGWPMAIAPPLTLSLARSRSKFSLAGEHLAPQTLR